MTTDSRQPTPMRGRTQPTLDEVAGLPQLTVLDHPVAASLVTLLRDIRTPGSIFARTVEELTRFLLHQALADAPTRLVEVPGHSGQLIVAPQLESSIAAIAILRAGLGMVEPVRHLAPGAAIYQVGIKRNEETLQPLYYYSNLPSSFAGIDHVLLLDPMLATGGSASAALGILRQSYAGPVSFLGIIGAPLGVRRLVDADETIRIYLAALDQGLDERGYIIPGLGDAGDRIFGTG